MKIAAILVDGFEEIEALYVIDLLRRANIEIDLITNNETLTVLGSHNIKVFAEKNISNVDFNDYSGILLPGGMGFKNYESIPELLVALMDFNAKDKFIFAICASPTILAKLRILKLRKSTVYTPLKDILIDNGAIYLDEAVVVDRNIITARSIAASKDFSLSIIENLKGIDERKKIELEIINY